MKTISYREFLAKLDKQSRVLDYPHHGSFEVTPLCNLDCKMCYVHLKDGSVKQSMLSGDQWVSIMKEAINQGMLSALLTGGEALMHPDFRNIYLYLIEHGVSVRLKTNGILLSGENLELFKNYPPQMIDVSLYGCNSESYISVTGHDAFAIVRDNIREAISAGLTLRLMITASKYMQPWTEEIMLFARSLNAVDVVVNSLLIDAREGIGRIKDDYDIAFLKDKIDIVHKKRELFPPKFISKEEEDLIYGTTEKHPDVSDYGLYCNGGRTGFAINWDGVMVPCVDFPTEILSAYPLRDGFDVAWKFINTKIRNYQVPIKCHSCPINDKCHYCPIQHGKFAIQHTCNQTVCDYWYEVFNK